MKNYKLLLYSKKLEAKVKLKKKQAFTNYGDCVKETVQFCPEINYIAYVICLSKCYVYVSIRH